MPPSKGSSTTVASVVTTGRRMARVAGELRHRDRLDSCHVVDCLVVATAVRLGAGLIATGDTGDIRRLAGAHPNVRVHALDGRSWPTRGSHRAASPAAYLVVGRGVDPRTS